MRPLDRSRRRAHRALLPIVVDGVEVLPVQGQVQMVAGAGGNVTLQIGPEGVLVVDSGGPGQTDKLLAAELNQ